MLWHNSFAGEGNRARRDFAMRERASALRLTIFAKICLVPAQIKRRINLSKALRVSGLWGVP